MSSPGALGSCPSIAMWAQLLLPSSGSVDTRPELSIPGVSSRRSSVVVSWKSEQKEVRPHLDVTEPGAFRGATCSVSQVAYLGSVFMAKTIVIQLE